MKKTQRLSTALVVACLLMVSCAGCDKPTNSTTIKTIAQQAGMWSAVSWIALDNPSSAQVGVVGELMDQLKDGAANVAAGKTYTEVLYPGLVTYINASVHPQYRPLAKTGILSALSALDLLFVMYPDWRTDEQLALDVVQAFVTGAQGGLSLQETDPVMKQARQQGAMRVYIFKEARVVEAAAELQRLRNGQRDGS